jgi:two-component system, cell cycle sensor histidine kinase and response regulator CckA
VRQLVEHFGGQIRVKSALGQGTTFELAFPRSNEADIASQKPRAIPNQNKALRVLLVDDDPLVRSSLSRLLGRDNYDVLAVANGSEALAVLSVTPDLHCVVSDVSMPHMDGEMLAERIKLVRPDLPMVLMSGNREPVLALTSGVRRVFVMKPVTWDDLRTAVQQVTRV